MITAIIITIVACSMWWWLIQHSLQFYRLRTSTIYVILGLSILGILSIISFPHIYQLINHQSWTNPLTFQSVIQYIIYIALVGGIINIIAFYHSGSTTIRNQYIIIIIIGLIGVILPYRGRYPLYYYLIAAGVEEYVKYYTGYGLFRSYGISSSDIILFGLLSGLGFASIENIIYLINSHEQATIVIQNTTRRMIGPIVHMIYSGSIAYGYWFFYRRNNNISGLAISSLVIILLHTVYNTYIGQWGWYGAIAIIIIGYVIISRMLYNCDRLYFEAKNNLKTTS